MTSTLTAETLRDILHYDQATGVFTYKVSARGVAGRFGGYSRKRPDPGCINIMVRGRSYLAHRLAWLYMTGEWPADQIDHKNRVGTDNRWENLRAATNQQNQFNTTVRRNNKCGLKGVHWSKEKKKWRAQIGLNGKTWSLGYYLTPEDASAAYRDAASVHARVGYT